MFNIYEIEQTASARQKHLREQAIQNHLIQGYKQNHQSLVARLSLVFGDLLIISGHKLKSWTITDPISMKQYRLDVK